MKNELETYALELFGGFEVLVFDCWRGRVLPRLFSPKSFRFSDSGIGFKLS